MTEDRSQEDRDEDAERQRWPISFILLIGVAALYLGWRLVQGVGVLIGWATG
jgi:hypothetical protein